MKKIFTTSVLALALLSSSSFAVRIAQHVYETKDRSTVRISDYQKRVADERYLLDAEQAVEFNPIERQSGLYRLKVVTDFHEVSTPILVDDQLPSGFIQILDQLAENVVAIRFFENRVLPADIVILGDVRSEMNAETGIFTLSSTDADMFSVSFSGIKIHFKRLGNGKYKLEKVSYEAADRPDILADTLEDTATVEMQDDSEDDDADLYDGVFGVKKKAAPKPQKKDEGNPKAKAADEDDAATAARLAEEWAAQEQEEARQARKAVDDADPVDDNDKGSDVDEDALLAARLAEEWAAQEQEEARQAREMQEQEAREQDLRRQQQLAAQQVREAQRRQRHGHPPHGHGHPHGHHHGHPPHAPHQNQGGQQHHGAHGGVLPMAFNFMRDWLGFR